LIVIPAQAGIQEMPDKDWMPAFAGMTWGSSGASLASLVEGQAFLGSPCSPRKAKPTPRAKASGSLGTIWMAGWKAGLGEKGSDFSDFFT
jgi:hypothetical protein